MSNKKIDKNNNTELDIRKGIVQLFNTKEYHELQLYYNFKSIFDALGIMRNENVHSNFLAWILNSDQSHGLNDYPIRKFLEMITMVLYDVQYTNEDIALLPEYLTDYIITGNYDVIDVKIEREKVITDNKRIDIFIDLVINITNDDLETLNIKLVIENKVYSKEHSDQTSQYYQWAKQNYNENDEMIFIYLTPIPNIELLALPEQQCRSKNYIQINYQYLVDYVLEPCRRQQLPQEAKFFIDNYLRCLSYPSIDEENMKQGGLVMAVSERERKLLLDFWETNKPLLLAMLNVLKDDDDIDEEERENMENMINTISTYKDEKDRSKYCFDGKKYSKRKLVWAVIKDYVSSSNPSYSSLKNIFDDAIQGSLGVIQTKAFVEERDPSRFFSKPEEILTTGDGEKIVVCNQWGIDNINGFIKVAKQLGYEISKEAS